MECTFAPYLSRPVPYPSRPAVPQERDLQAGLPRGLLPSRGGGDDEREVESAHLVYLGLAAAAFLLLTLYPDAAPAGGGSPKAALPLACSGALSASGERPGAVQLPVFYPRRLFAVLRW